MSRRKIALEDIISVQTTWWAFPSPEGRGRLFDPRDAVDTTPSMGDYFISLAFEREIGASTSKAAAVHDGIEIAIERSRSLLELPSNWDGEGASPIRIETWESAMSFLRGLAREYASSNFGFPAAPTISPGPEASIDLYWNTDSRELLINYPENPSSQPTFSAEDKSNGSSFRGMLHRSAVSSAIVPLIPGNPMNAARTSILDRMSPVSD